MNDCFFDEGVADYFEGYDFTECPYDEGTDGQAGWQKGWLFADATQ